METTRQQRWQRERSRVEIYEKCDIDNFDKDDVEESDENENEEITYVFFVLANNR